MTDGQTENTERGIRLGEDEAGRIVAEAALRYFENRRLRVDGFIDRHFSLAGSAAIHRHALGWDLLKAPANIALAVPNLVIKVSAAVLQKVGSKRIATYLAACKL